MRPAKKIALIVGVLALAVAAWAYFRPESDLHWIQRVTSVQLPRGIQDVSLFSNREFYITAHASLPHDGVESFAQRYRFVRDPDAIRHLVGVESLEPRFSRIPEDADLVAYSARTKEHKWTYVLDKKTGSLWVTVFYPDMSGDPP